MLIYCLTAELQSAHPGLTRFGYSSSIFRMPTMDGIELLKKVKAVNPSVKTILISAFGVNDEIFEQCNCIDVFLQKPTSIPDLIEAVETQIATTHLPN